MFKTKVQSSIKIDHCRKHLVPASVLLLVNYRFWSRGGVIGWVPMKIWDFTNISLFSKILTVELFGNLVRNKFYCTILFFVALTKNDRWYIKTWLWKIWRNSFLKTVFREWNFFTTAGSSFVFFRLILLFMTPLRVFTVFNPIVINNYDFFLFRLFLFSIQRMYEESDIIAL